MEVTDEEEELLSLRLAIATDHGRERLKKKRKRSREALNGGFEGKVLSLLQMREQMVKAEQYKEMRRKLGVAADGKGLHLIHLLLISATSVDAKDVSSAVHSLTELYRGVSLTGDSVQRVAAHFADALVARLLTPNSPFFDMLTRRPTPEEEFLAFTHLYKASVYYQFAHFTANQAILEAFEEEHEDGNNDTTMALHVIDLELSYGFQWPSLIQSLSEKASSASPISLRITGFGTSLAQLQETETRLVSFAKGFRNLVFEFQGLLRGSNIVNIRKKKNETVAVNLAFYLTSPSSLTDISETLNNVHSLGPSVVVLVEQEGSRSPRSSFLSRFVECLHHFAAMFDSLDDCLPLDSIERLSIEKNHLGKQIKGVLTTKNWQEQDMISIKDEAAISCSKYERMETWKGRMEGHGFAGLKLSSKSMIQAKLLLKIRSHCCPCPIQADQGGSTTSGGFRVFERDEGRALSLGWQDRCLITASAWNCV